MARILIIKISSLGDIIHTLPALTEAVQHNPFLKFDWVVEEAFAEIPRWHPNVDRIIPIALRRWRKKPYDAWKTKEWQEFYTNLRIHQYDYIIDAQGLIKSAVLSYLARGKRYGLNWHSASEGLASLIYQHKINIASQQHAIKRVKQLFSQILNYSCHNLIDYGIDKTYFTKSLGNSADLEEYLVFLPNTTWPTKHWPEVYWQELAKLISKNSPMPILIPWGNTVEYARAQRIAASSKHIQVLPKLTLTEIAKLLTHANAVVTVDTGLGHLAAALDTPTVALYGPTNPVLTGIHGSRQIHVAAEFSCAPCLQTDCTYKGDTHVQPACFKTITPQRVWQELQTITGIDKFF